MPCEEVKEGRRVRRVHTALIVKWREGRGGRAAGRITVCSTDQAGGGRYMG